MALRLPTHWAWDSWPIDDGDQHHLFYLQAPRSLGDPDRRHHNASIGHAVSTDYENWSVLPDALTPAESPAWDDLATWTGSVVRAPDHTWHLFYSAISRRDGGRVQRIGRAHSTDLITWHRPTSDPLLEADPRWYETTTTSWREVAWRDPWVIQDPSSADWHMLITARVPHGPAHSRGVIAHAQSTDLITWSVHPPLTTPAGFGHLEVPHAVTLNNRPVLLFCCTEQDISPTRQATTLKSGMWSAPAATLTGPYDMEAATPIEDPSIYAAHLVNVPNKGPALLGFSHHNFNGVINSPLPVRMRPNGTLSTQFRTP